MTRGIALVTGAGRGVGRATAERLARGGYVVVAGVRDVPRALEEIGEPPGIHLVPLDVTRPDQVRAAAEIATDFAGGGAIDVLVNNAGYAMMAPQESGDLDVAREMFETNVWGAAAMVQALAPAMREVGRGTIVNVSSIGARFSNPLIGFYHASKYALSALSEALSVEMAPFGVRVVMIEPGMIDTDFSSATRLSGGVADPASPYAPLFGGLRAGFSEWRARPDTSTGASCATAIWDAVHAEEPPIRVVVGGDAAELDVAIRDAADDADFQHRQREFLGLDWSPRPAAPARPLMQVVAAPAPFKGALGPAAAAAAIAAGARAAGADVREVPMADGGEGTLDALVSAAGGRTMHAPARDPLGRAIRAPYGVLPDGTAVVELAAASGFERLSDAERDPEATTTAGTGDLMRAALDGGCRRIVLGVGGSATTDGGLGIVIALGARALDAAGRELPGIGGVLAAVRRVDLSSLDPRLRAVPVEVACDVVSPLAGPDGAARVFAPQKGADPDAVARLDVGLLGLAAVLAQQGYADVTRLPGPAPRVARPVGSRP